MPIARREVLRLGTALAVSSVAAACVRSSPQARVAPDPTGRPSAPAGLLPPAEGSLYFGASVPYGRSVSAWEQDLGAVLSVHRSYFRSEADQVGKLVKQCRVDLLTGRLPHVSIKPGPTWGAVAAGERDDWAVEMLASLDALAAPAILTVHHEPENDAGPPGMQPADFVAMQERVIALAADLAPRVLVVPVLQHWTFDPLRDDIDPSAWIVPGASAFGVDVYNPWSPGNGKAWRSLGSKLDEVAHWIEGRPVVIGEYGCRNDPRNPTLGTEWLYDAAEHARAHGVISMSYFNSGENAPDGSYVLAGEMESAFAGLLSSPWVARV